jgi:hypothetical protein
MEKNIKKTKCQKQIVNCVFKVHGIWVHWHILSPRFVPLRYKGREFIGN